MTKVRTKIKTAMVMAAGHGTRMRPLTNDRSKAMVEVGGKPLIDHMLDRLENIGVKRAVVNVHAHADHLEAHLKTRKTGPEIIISDEREALLETGGGVVKALPLFGNTPILICNIDAIWIEFDSALKVLLAEWKPKIMDELFLLARRDSSLGYSGKGDFDILDGGRLLRRTNETADHVYAGVEIFKPQLAGSYQVEKFSRNVIWNDSLKLKRVFGVELPGYWMHVGDPRAALAADAVLKQAKDLSSLNA